MGQILAAVLILTHIVKTQLAFGDVQAGDHKRVFAALCALANFANIDPKLDTLDWSGETTYDELLKLNLTLSDTAWTAQFDKDKETQKRPQQPPPDKRGDKSWTDNWQQWLKAADGIDQQTNKDALLTAYGLATATETERKHTLIKLAGPLARAAASMADLQETKNKNDDNTPEQIRKTLNAAIFGEALPADASFKPANAYTGDVDSSTVENNCKGEGTTHKTKTIAVTIVCVCGKGNSKGLSHVCADNQAETYTNLGARYNKATEAYADIIKSCPPRAEKQLTAQELEAALKEVTKQLQTATGKAYLGTLVTGKCDGASDSGICVEYTGYARNTPKPFSTVPWVTNLEVALSKLNRHERAVQQATALSNQIKKEQQTARNLAMEVTALRDLHKQPSRSPAPNGEATSDAVLNKRKECEVITKFQECKDKGECKWDGGEAKEGNHCKLNTTLVEQQATRAGTGDKTGETTSKCTGQDTKEKCEGVQGTPAPGKKSVCGWITYEDGKGTLDKPYCRDSSFLVNNKFALSVVSAVFVALLF
uniref:Variant surface glycoprotein 318 n=1 Tax=Trypanosoma brucei TaxID=5691 RepID=M4SWT8_9TRYP|nr:variant surface glycoprotein 318 [Trypanosoma brucei]